LPAQVFKSLLDFEGSNGDGPEFMAFVHGTDGDFYGVTAFGGDLTCNASSGYSGCGTVFKISAGGKLTTLHIFESSDGANPYGGPIQVADGNFYGTTVFGGN
jgi:uncharacterized repeat protein (TIGR03803 family)